MMSALMIVRYQVVAMASFKTVKSAMTETPLTLMAA
jgi:hypothetical protein